MIHTYSLFGKNICIDTESGSIHLLEPLAFSIIQKLDESFSEVCPKEIFKSFPEHTKEEIEEAYSELYQLYKEDMIFAKRDYVINLPDEYPVKALCLHIAHDCNLRCKYCFAEGGDFCTGKKLMSFEVAKAAIDFIVEKSGDRRNLEVDFFGGEPLMNFKVVKQTVDYARSFEKQKNKNFRFTLTTNGILLNDEISEYLNKEMSNVVLSLDGRKEVNDDVRVRVGGTGSYDSIVPKYQKFVKDRNGENYYLRGTFTAKNLDFSKDVMHMKELGFDQLSVEPVVLEEDSEYALRDHHLPKIFDEYEKLALDIYNINNKDDDFVNFFHFMIDLAQGPCVVKRVKGCGSGSEYVAVSPEGDIYPCHRFVGKPEFLMGNVLETQELKPELVKKFAESNVLNKPDCEECWAKYYCSGGCAANNFNFNGDLFTPHKLSCDLEKKRIECAIALKAINL